MTTAHITPAHATPAHGTPAHGTPAHGTAHGGDANIRVPAETRDRLAMIAAGEGMSLRAYLARLADGLLTPAERVERTERARQILREWNGYNPTAEEEASLDSELDRRIARATQ